MVHSETHSSKNDGASEKCEWHLADEAATQAFAEACAEMCRDESAFQSGLVVYLQGDLGAGKSFFSRAFIQCFLPNQKVKSPTYTLVETYPTEHGPILHFDLYRLCDPEELEFLAIRDLMTPPFIALVEWPSKGAGILPEADLRIELAPEDTGRKISITPMKPAFEAFVRKLTKKIGTVIDYD